MSTRQRAIVARSNPEDRKVNGLRLFWPQSPPGRFRGVLTMCSPDCGNYASATAIDPLRIRAASVSRV
jgi:hypothetical protein